MLNGITLKCIMLAFELYKRNKDSSVEIWPSAFPIKKIFADNDKFTIDETTLEQYGKKPNEKFAKLQEWLSMPLNMSATNLINLPYKVSGSNSRRPYLIIYGIYESTKTKDPKIKLSLESQDNVRFTAELDLKTQKQTINSVGKIITKLDKENYKIGPSLLIDEYVRARIIDKNETFSSTTFKKIVNAFFEFILSKEFEDFKTKPIRFGLVILPSKEKIKYVTKLETVNNTLQFIDAFNTRSNSYGTKPTQTAKFMSFDDPAFTINCTNKDEFYKNLYIGSESLKKINIVMDEVINIAGLGWFFSVIDYPELKFEKTGAGFYDQIYYNYQKLVSKGDMTNKHAQMKIMCFKTTQAKIEIFIDENVTMAQIKQILDRAGSKKPVPGVLEHLIQKDGKKTLWNNYLGAVRTFLLGNFMEREKLLSILTMMFRKQLFSLYLKSPVDAKTFFTKSGFCVNLLCKKNEDYANMNNSEKFAYGIGKIAGAYVKFKRDIKEESNSLSDILTYSKYDREKLRFVSQRVALGIHLSKADQLRKQSIVNFVSKTQPSEEIPEPEADHDLSYFFYKGVFEEIGGQKIDQ